MNNEIIKSLNTSLSYLLAINTKNITKAIVSSDGTGHYITLTEAITAGEKYILLKKGTHEINNNIIITNQHIFGESRRDTILKFNNKIKLVFDSTGDRLEKGEKNIYEIKTTKDSTLITQAGTGNCGFSTVTKQDNTRLNTRQYNLKIKNITDTNNLNIDNKFYGKIKDFNNDTIKMQPYNLGNFNSIGAEINNLTMEFMTKQASNITNGIEIYGLNHIIRDINFRAINDNVTFIHTAPDNENDKICSYLTIENNFFEGGYQSIELDYITNSTIKNNYFTNNKRAGIYSYIGEIVRNLTIENNKFIHSTIGIKLEKDIENIIIKNNTFMYIKEEVIAIAGNGTGLTNYKTSILLNKFIRCSRAHYAISVAINNANIVYNTFKECNFPIYLKWATYKSQLNNIISNNIILDCGTNDTIWTNATGVIIKNNIIKNSGTIQTTGNYSIIQGNKIINTTVTEPIKGNNIKIIGNIFENKTDKKITFSGNNNSIVGNFFIKIAILITGDRNVIKGNQIRSTSGSSLHFATTIEGDNNMFTINIIKDCVNAFEIKTSADKTNVCNNIWNNVTTTTYLDNGTNTIVNTNITV